MDKPEVNMQQVDADLISRVREYVEAFITDNTPAEFLYHSIDHTRGVARSAEKIGREEGLSEHELNIAIIAAWFHDTGYIIKVDGHESESARIAEEFLSAEDVNQDVISQVKASILSTRIPQSPADIVSEVLCDADLFHLSSEDYFSTAEALRLEKSFQAGKKISKRKFRKISVDFIENHRYHTEYGKRILQPKKEANLARIKKRSRLATGN